MKKRILAVLLSACMIIGMMPMTALAETTASTETSTWGSDYETATEFTISSVSDLQAFATMVNEGKDFSGKTVTLTSDLDLSGVTSWVPIGSLDVMDEDYDWDDPALMPFAGTFDGGDNTISNLSLSSGTDKDDPCYDYTGLFGYVTGTVKNVILDNLSITAAYNYLGGIAGYLDSSGEIDNCTVSGTISGATYDDEAWGSYVGGVVGYSDGKVINCTSNCQLNNVIEYVGGIVGLCETGTISGCTSNSEISDTLTTVYVGGIVGQLGASGYSKGGSVINCTNTGSLGAYAYSGGIVGCAYNSTISGCANSGTITGNEWSTNSRENRRIAGIVGDTQGTTISDCTNTGTVDAEALQDVGGIVGLLYYGSTVTDCTNSGDITGGKNTGGIVGFAESYSTEGYEVTGCTNSGEVTGGEGVGGIVGVGTANDSVNGRNTKQIISDCVNSGEVSGKDNVGGIVGEHNSDVVNTASATSVATVSGCINTGSVSATDENGSAGAIVGNNNDATKSSDTSGETNPGIVQNNFWPEELNLSAVASGAGSSDTESTETVKNNSAYDSEGNLTSTDVTDEEGNAVTTIADAADKLLGGTDKAPEVLKVTATFNTNGYGAAPAKEEAVLGGTITLPTLSNYGYNYFQGWTDKDGKFYKAGESVIITADTTFTAQWVYIPPVNPNPSYSITAPSVDNGALSVSPANATKNTDVTITVTPDKDYELASLTVVDANGNRVPVKQTGENKFTFTMPASKVTVSASFSKVVKTLPFTDVSADDYFFDAVVWAVENGVTYGNTATTFGVGVTCNRADAVTFIWRAYGCPAPKTTVNPFTDISENAYYYEAVLWAVENGVTVGTSATTFSPLESCRREHIVTFLYRAAGSPPVSHSSGFVDVADSAYYANAVTWAAENGITVGAGSTTTFGPTQNCFREQIVTFLYRNLAE